MYIKSSVTWLLLFSFTNIEFWKRNIEGNNWGQHFYCQWKQAYRYLWEWEGSFWQIKNWLDPLLLPHKRFACPDVYGKTVINHSNIRSDKQFLNFRLKKPWAIWIWIVYMLLSGKLNIQCDTKHFNMFSIALSISATTHLSEKLILSGLFALKDTTVTIKQCFTIINHSVNKTFSLFKLFTRMPKRSVICIH